MACNIRQESDQISLLNKRTNRPLTLICMNKDLVCATYHYLLK